MEEQNSCDKCECIMNSIDLVWITAEDFEPKENEVIPKEVYEKYDALCEKCYSELIIMKKYKTIVIDPPWKINCNLKDTKYYRCGKPMPYRLMTDEEILNFRIHNFADEDCDLFMWTTLTKLPVAINILKEWGFKYHILMTWDKTNGIGLNGFHRKTELVVYGYKGKMGIDRSKGKYIPTLFTEKLTTHSTKPELFYKLIKERTKEPRVDIFARRKIDGFDSWGDEVKKEKTQ